MLMKHRLCGSAALAAVLAVALPLGSAVQAAAPQQKTQAPGYYGFMLSDVEITALSDGTFQMDVGGNAPYLPAATRAGSAPPGIEVSR